MHMATTQNCIIFKTKTFNTTIRRDYFLNPSCFGDDAARWLISELAARGHRPDTAPGQQDFGWHFGFHAGGARHTAVIGFRPGMYGGEGEWICWIQRRPGSAGGSSGKQLDVQPEAVKTIQDILISSPTVTVLKFCDWKDLW
jgi:hypothetical protein